MSIIQHVLSEELERLEKLAQKYKRALSSLPKGSLSKKTRNGQVYIYRAYREKDKVKFEYIGKESSSASQEAQKALSKRQDYLSKLKKVNKDLIELRRALRGKKG